MPSVGTPGVKLVANRHRYNTNRRPLRPLNGITLPSVKQVCQKCSQMDILLKSGRHATKFATWWRHDMEKYRSTGPFSGECTRQNLNWPVMRSGAVVSYAQTSCSTNSWVPNYLRRHDPHVTSLWYLNIRDVIVMRKNTVTFPDIYKCGIPLKQYDIFHGIMLCIWWILISWYQKATKKSNDLGMISPSIDRTFDKQIAWIMLYARRWNSTFLP